MKSLFVVTRVKGRAWDASQPLRAQSRWHEHAAFMDGLVATGFVVLGGPVGEAGEIMLVVDAADERAVLATLAKDPWSEAGILEVRKVRRWEVLLQARGTA